MGKHKVKIIAAAVICIALVGAWLMGGAPDIYTPAAYASPDIYATDDENMPEDYPPAEYALQPTDAELYYNEDTGEEIDNGAVYLPEEIGTETGAGALQNYAYTVEDTDNFEDIEEDEPAALEDTPYESQPEPPGEETEEAPEPTPEPEVIIADDESFTVTLTIRVDMLLYNMHLLDGDKHELVPLDGFIFPQTTVIAYPGESVFNILQREMRRARIHMASRFTPVFNSAYIEAINNLYEFDAGALSGWVYSVNGSFPGFGSSRYLLSPGDDIVWHFTLDRGRDVGALLPPGGQEDE